MRKIFLGPHPSERRITLLLEEHPKIRNGKVFVLDYLVRKLKQAQDVVFYVLSGLFSDTNFFIIEGRSPPLDPLTPLATPLV